MNRKQGICQNASLNFNSASGIKLKSNKDQLLKEAILKEKGIVTAIIFLTISLSLLFNLSTCSSVKQKPADGVWYTYQAGDTLEKISKRFSVSMMQIQRANDIFDPEDLDEGTKLFIPKTQIDQKPVEKEIGKAANIQFDWPAQGTISSGYGIRQGKMHEGIDITKDMGRDVRSAADGIILFSGNKNGFGKTIIVNHGHGLKTLYAHNARIYVRKGTQVKRGDIISQMGTTGRSSGIHLHFEVHVYGKPRNPLRYLPAR